MDIRELPPVDVRVESGAIRFGSDWPGWFLRGDDAAYFLACMEAIEIPDNFYGRQINRYLEEIKSKVIQRGSEDEFVQHGHGDEPSLK